MPIDFFEAQRFSRLELLARQNVEGFITGLHRSPYHGFSVEFAEHRAYNSGESTKHIDWKLFGRTDKMFVKRYEEETNLRCNIVLDRSGSMFYPRSTNGATINKLQFAVQSAASLAYLMRSQRDAVGLTVFGDGIELSTAVRSSVAHHSFLFHELERLYDQTEGAHQSNVVESLHVVSEKSHRRSLVVIFSDFMDTLFRGQADQHRLFEALQHLRYNKHEVVLFHVYDKATELDFNLENRPYAMVDLETGEKIKLMPNDIREQYRALREQRVNEIKLRCRQYGIDWNACDIREGVVKVLDHFLAKRSRMN